MAITNIILAIAVIAIGVAIGSILSSLQTASAQNLTSTENSKITSLGGPFFIEKGRIIGQRVLSVGPQPQIEFTVVANATINGNISATNTGTTVITPGKDTYLGSFVCLCHGLWALSYGRAADVHATLAKDRNPYYV